MEVSQSIRYSLKWWEHPGDSRRLCCPSEFAISELPTRESLPGGGCLGSHSTSEHPGRLLRRRPTERQLQNPPDRVLSENSSGLLLSNTCLFTCSKQQGDDTGLMGSQPMAAQTAWRVAGVSQPERGEAGLAGQAAGAGQVLRVTCLPCWVWQKTLRGVLCCRLTPHACLDGA